MTKKKRTRQPNPAWRAEGEILETARKRAYLGDRKYTQEYTAQLVGKDQGIWTQWKTGIIRITDADWIAFALHFGFDPFATRPALVQGDPALREAVRRFRPQELDPSPCEIDLARRIAALPPQGLAAIESILTIYEDDNNSKKQGGRGGRRISARA